jgi:hypothetical protein
MFAKILSMAREKFRKPSSQQEESPAEDIVENPIAEFLIQIDAKGDFAVGAECFSTEEQYVHFMGMTLYLLNSGMLADYLIESLRLCSEGDEAKLKFVRNSILCWKEMCDQGTDAVDASANKDAVDPKDVFSFYAMRP